MKLDLRGRVNNIYLPKTKALSPLFEAIVNSLQALEDIQDNRKAQIKICVRRDNAQGTLAIDEGNNSPIQGFVVEDNGKGFTTENYNAFETSDTTKKQEKGGRGVGRFLWLKAFDKVRIESNYREGGESFFRAFDFTLNDEEGIINQQLKKSEETAFVTRVSLEEFKSRYREACPKRLDTIAIKVIEHCLPYFLKNNCPHITIADDVAEIDLNDRFNELIKSNSEIDRFKIASYEFELIHLKRYSSDDYKHRIHYCANGREVLSEPLGSVLPGLNKKIKEDEHKSFVYAGYLSGPYLDESVNQERSGFIFADEEDKLEFPELVTKNELWDKAVGLVKQYVTPFTEPALQDNLKRVKKYIREEKPEYRFLLQHKEQDLKTIPLGLPVDKLEIELFKKAQEFDLELKQKTALFLNRDMSAVADINEYEKEFNKYIEQINDLGKANLARYILHRKVILDLLENRLKLGENARYDLEENIHKLFFPMRKTSDQIDYENQNLWLIDERLAYHYYLASDMPLSRALLDVEDAGSEEDLRPDIVVFNNPLAFVGEEQPYSSIVIIEFKRPGRINYADDNPIEQVYRYIKGIQTAKRKDNSGRPIIFNNRIPFYAYIICDLTEKVREYAETAGLTITPDDMGYYGYNQNYRAYVEVISYQKLLLDSKKRNKVLFDRLFSGHHR